MRLLAALLLPVMAYGATGRVVFRGSSIDSGNIYLSHTSSLAADGNFSTWYGGASANQWTGMDMGAAVTIRAALITPRMVSNDCGSGISCWDRGLGQNVIEASNDPTFATGTVTLDTLTLQPLISEMAYNRRTLTAGSTYRYYRVRFPAAYGDLAELRWIGDAQAGVNAQPVAPVISPFGGAYLSGSRLITITSETTSAVIRYTTDGSTPTCSSTLYSAPFPQAIGSATTVKAVACDATLSTNASEISTANYRNTGYASGVVEYDVTTGVKAQIFSGSILGPVGGYYYRTGQWMLAGPCGQYGYTANPCSTIGVWLYKSRDLYNWSLVGQILDDGTSGGHTYTAINRFHAIYNASTHKYVGWGHCIDGTNINISANNSACIATADNIEGPWTWTVVQLNPDGHGYKDCILYRDDNGDAYTAYTDGTQSHIYVSQLASDYLSTVSSVLAVTGAQESPVLFRRGATWFLIHGPSTPYGGTVNPVYDTASSPLGTWTSRGTLFSGGATTGYGGQPSYVYQVPGKVGDAYMYGSDLWSSTVWQTTPLVLPLTFPTSTSVEPTAASWDLTLWVDSEIVIATAALPHSSVGASYSQTLSTVGSGPIAWSVTAGSLPAGLSLHSDTGVLDGTPTTAGMHSFTVTATNGTAPAATHSYAVNITGNGPARILSGSLSGAAR